jgi:hypothetical protein
VKFFIALIFSFLSVASYSQCDTVHNLTISSIGTQSAVISATPSSGSTSFIVYYYPQNDTSKAKYIIGNSPNFTITGLTPNTAYITFMGNWCGPTTIKSQKGKYLFTTAGITQSTNKFLIHNGFGDEYGVLKARKGFILPKADTLAAPLETGEIRYDTASQVNYQWTGEMWQPLAAGGDFTLGYDTNFIKAPLNVLSINTKGLNGYNGHINFKDFGAIGNGVYNTSGDLNALASGTYNDNALNTVFSRQADGGVSKQGGVELTLPVGAYRTHAKIGGFNISSHNNILRGQGVGNTILHFERSSDLNESAITFGKSSGDADTRLIRGGGVEDVSIKTNNGNIVNDALTIDYTEYQTYQNLNIEGFYRSALKMGIWESRFNNITIRATGAGQTATNGAPDYGVIDFDSHSASNPYRDACNNTTFDKLTLSGLYGTHIRASAIANTIVNININGLYDETYPGNGGYVDTLPIYYFNAVRNFNINGGFLTVNETGVNRDRYAVVISNDSRNSWVNFTNFTFNQNISSTDGNNRYATNATRALKGFVYLGGANAKMSCNNVIFFDPSGSVGVGATGSKYLIDGEDSSEVKFHNVVFEVKRGTWDSTNIINPAIKVTGDYTIRYYTNSWPYPGEYHYNVTPDVPISDSSNKIWNSGTIKKYLSALPTGNGGVLNTDSLQTVLDRGNTTNRDIILKDGTAVKAYDGSSFKGMVASASGNPPGLRYFGLVNYAADFLGLVSNNAIQMISNGAARLTLDSVVHAPGLPTVTGVTQQLVLDGDVIKKQTIVNSVGDIKVIPDANYTILSSDKVLILNEPTSARTITLPAASTLPNKEITLIVKTTTSGRWILAGSFIQQPGASITEDFINSGLNAITYRLASDGNKWYQE